MNPQSGIYLDTCRLATTYHNTAHVQPYHRQLSLADIIFPTLFAELDLCHIIYAITFQPLVFL